MRKVLILLTVLITQLGYAQFRKEVVPNLENEDMKPLNWGYFLGFNSYDFKFDYHNFPEGGDVLVDTSVGFNVGLIGELRINNHLDIRLEPGLFYTQRNLMFQNPAFDESDALRETRSTYIHFPLLLKMSAKRVGNFKPFLLAGVSTSLNLGSREKSLDDNRNGTFRMRKNTQYYELGFGVDFYLPYFKFAPSIRGVFALTDEHVPDFDPNSPWTGNIKSMKTRGIFINFTFE